MDGQFRKKRLGVLSVLLLLLLFACGDSILNPRVKIDEPFQLKYGQFKILQPDNLVITFEQLISDSRCPIGVVCFIAGDAEILLRLQKGNSDPTTIHLKIGLRVTKKDTFAHQFVDALGYRFTLMELDPHPYMDKHFSKSSYTAFLKIQRNRE